MSEKKYVVFRLENEHYGVDIMNVREVSEFKDTLKIPNTPAFIDGVINLRGEITPIISLKKRFNLSGGYDRNQGRVIVVNMNDKLIGFLVDEASQVLTIEDSNIDPTPEIISGIDRRYIDGIGKIDDKMVIILDFEKVLSESEKHELEEM